MTPISSNSAILPVPNRQKDNYDWAARRKQKLEQAASGNHALIFIGDSITHHFETEERGLPIWQRYYGQRNALDLGYGWDCTQNILWRLENGEFAGQRPKLVVLLAGTNNLTGNETARANTVPEIVAGIGAICDWIHLQSSETTILLMAVLPRGLSHEPIHTQVEELNAALKASLEDKPLILHLDIGCRFLGPDGEIPTALMEDRCHPTEQGYAIWAEAIEPIVAQFL